MAGPIRLSGPPVSFYPDPMRILFLLIALVAFVLGLATSAQAQDVPPSIAPVLAWDIESAYQNEAGMGHVVFVRADSSVTPTRIDSLHAYYGRSGEGTAWEANVAGVRYVFTKAWGMYVLDAQAVEGVESYHALLDRYGDATMNGIPDIVDALEHLAYVKASTRQ